MYYLLQKSDGIIHRGNNTNNKLKLHFKTEALTDDICVISKSLKIQRKTPVSEATFNKFAGVSATLLKKRHRRRRFPVSFTNF